MTAEARLRDDGRIEVPGGLRLTLQRAFAEDWTGDGRVPRSYGRLPFVQVPGDPGFAIPMLPGEIVWIGLEAPQRAAVAKIEVVFSDSVRPLIRRCPPDFAIAGTYAREETRPFAVGDALRLSVHMAGYDAPCGLRLQAFPAERVLTPSWQEAHGRLDRTHGYAGARLP